MSRSGYNDYDDDGGNWQLIMWRGAVASSIRGRRGQLTLLELLVALDAMPEKRLIAKELEKDGEVCALGCLGRQRGINQSAIDPEDYTQVAKTFGIAEALAREIEYMNDEGGWNETPEQRWTRVRAWVASKIRPEAA